MHVQPHHRQYATVFLFDLAMVCGFTATPFFILEHLHGEGSMLGIITGLQWAAYALVCVCSSSYVARARNGLTFALVGSGLFTLLYPLAALTRNPYLFGVLTISAMGATALFWPAMQSWVGAEPDPRLRAKRLSHYNISWTAGLTLAPLVAGWAYHYGPGWPFAVVFVVGGAAFILILTLPHEKDYFPKPPNKPVREHVEAHHRSEAHLYAAWVALLLTCLLVTVVAAIFPKRMVEVAEQTGISLLPGQAPLSGDTILYFTWLATVMYGARAGASFIMGCTHSWQHKAWLLVLTELAAALSVWVLSFTTNLLAMALCALAIGGASGTAFFASQFYSVTDPAKKHRRLTIHEFMVGLGCLAGAVGFGLLADIFDTPWPFRWGPFFIAVGLVIQQFSLRIGHATLAKARDEQE